MTSLTRYLLTMGILLGAALIAGVVVWYLYQDLRPAALEKKFEIGTTTPTGMEENASVGEAVTSQEEMGEAGSESSHSISASSLTEAQKSMLASYGIDSSKFVITEAMIACAKVGVGEARLEEILKGSAPTPYEAKKLVPCVNAE